MTSGFSRTGQDSLQSGAAAGRVVSGAMRDPMCLGAGPDLNEYGTTGSARGARADTHGRGADERAGSAAGSGGRVERPGNIGNACRRGHRTGERIGLAGAEPRGARELPEEHGGRPGPTATASFFNGPSWRQWRNHEGTNKRLAGSISNQGPRGTILPDPWQAYRRHFSAVTGITMDVISGGR